MFPVPDRNCGLCPRLAAFRDANRAAYPDFFNAPVPGWGDPQPTLLIVGLAPGLKGANRTGRPFTGDYAGDLLYSTLIKYGFARGVFRADPNDGLQLVRCRITNAVKCVPPENKPTPAETRTCMSAFLEKEVASMTNLKAVLVLGQIAHVALLDALKVKRGTAPFGHGAENPLPNGATLFSSYHCSRYNTNTGRLTEAMFHAVFDRIASVAG
ncbi:MAG TPA: uracil-DNA glycosylase [Ferrovibrio sp.]|jgi:uracil-DNA glycosylase family 4|uniref:uracil-DNA glycosylase n=1 Tax=Ferrovibrio sp. TaxID=1917215 RepID=UPI002B4B5DB0|nr:uracil-DNA glycosylase [Ferrovibrio sp.]HLT75981.1 uracil-DNA glycosylase [Ferrovibrio sp.]